MIPLGVLPAWTSRLLLVLAVAGAGAMTGWAARGLVMAPQLAQAAADLSAARADLADLRAAIAQEREAAAAAVLAEQERQTKALQEIARHERTIRALRRAAADDADRAAVELQHAAADRAAAPPSDEQGPAAAGGGETARGTGLVFADVLGRCSARLAQLARWADEAHAAGLACQRSYDAVTATGDPHD